MEIYYKEAKADYFRVAYFPMAEMFNDSTGLKDLLNSDLVLVRLVPREWVGIIGFPP